MPRDTGDIILTPDKKKSGKKWIWAVAGVVALIVLIISGIWMMARDKNDNALLQSFDDLRNYIINSADYNSDNELIYALAPEVNVGEYYNGLQNKVDNFINVANGRIDTDELDGLLNTIRIMTNSVNYIEVRKGLIAAYDDGGVEMSKKYFAEKISCNEQSILGSICVYEEDYYEIELDNHMVYAMADCDDGGYDNECAVQYYGFDRFYDAIVTSVFERNGFQNENAREFINNQILENLNIIEALINEK